MAATRVRGVIQYLSQVRGDVAQRNLTDAELLERFVKSRDDKAFEVLIWRHGGLVMGLCRRMLRRSHDAEDAFQATFLTLVHKARSIGKHSSVSSWLYKVAYRVALKARARALRQPASANGTLDLLPDAKTIATPWDDLRPLLDEEIGQLPAHYRLPLILCYFEGKTHAQAAHELACPRGTIGTRLTRARELLRSRLERRGVALTGSALGLALASEAGAAKLAPPLVQTTLHSALATLTGQSAAGASVLALTEGVMHAMFMTKLKVAALMVAIFVGGAGTISYHAYGADPGASESLLAAQGGQGRASAQSGQEREEALRQENHALKKRIEELTYAIKIQAVQSRAVQEQLQGVFQALDEIGPGDEDYKRKRLLEERARGEQLRLIGDKLAKQRQQLQGELPQLELLLDLQPDRVDLVQVDQVIKALNAYRELLKNLQKLSTPVKPQAPGQPKPELPPLKSRSGTPVEEELVRAAQEALERERAARLETEAARDATRHEVEKTRVQLEQALAAEAHARAALEQALARERLATKPVATATFKDDVLVVNHRTFQLPISIDPLTKLAVAEVLLFASTDDGGTWTQVARATPDQKYFRYQAARDGFYCFAVQAIGQDQRKVPAEPKDFKPVVRVRVDATDAVDPNNPGDPVTVPTLPVRPLPDSKKEPPAKRGPVIHLKHSDDRSGRLGVIQVELTGEEKTVAIDGLSFQALDQLMSHLRAYRGRLTTPANSITLVVDSRVKYSDLIPIMTACESVGYTKLELKDHLLVKDANTPEALKPWSGEWELVLTEKNGIRETAQKPVRLLVDGDRLVYNNNPKDGAALRLNPGHNPMEVDFVDPDTLTLGGQGIYQFENNLLLICTSGGKAPRPKEMKTHPGSGHELAIYRRTSPR